MNDQLSTPKRPKILIIEDSSYLSDSLFDMLSISGYDGIVASTGIEGVAMAEEIKPDLILLDIRLPDIDGYEVYRRILNTSWGKMHAKFMILTASESTDTISKNIDLPPEWVLFKPEWSMSDLKTKISHCLATPKTTVME